MGRVAFSRRMVLSVMSQMWDVYAETQSQHAAAAAIGVDRALVSRWVAGMGGVRPQRHAAGAAARAAGPKPGSGPGSGPGRRLTFEDRCLIQAGLAVGQSQTQIAVGIGFHRSTVCREIPRGLLATGAYSAKHAHAKATAARQRPGRVPKLVRCPALAREVVAGLQAGYSPQQISGRLRREHPDDGDMQIHHDTIYESIYVQSRGALRADLARCLRSGRIRRRPRRPAGTTPKRGQIKDMVMISERPAEVADRAVPGHWEGDLVMGTMNKSAVGTLVERTTNYTMLLHLPDGHRTEQVTDALLARISQLPAQLRLSLTWDQGKEMAYHHKLTTGVLGQDFKVYFCDPHAPWQRATNENTNGLLRQYLPKGTDLSGYTAEDLTDIEYRLNDRPRRRLEYAKPSELIGELLLR